MTAPDWPEVRAICDEDIATRNATFITESPDWPAWDAGHLASCRSSRKCRNLAANLSSAAPR